MYLVKQLEMAIRGKIERATRNVGLTVPQYIALTILQRNPGISSAQLARGTFVSAQAANELVNALEAKGFINRAPSPKHAKVLEIRLSNKGSSVLDSCEIEIDEIEEQMLSEVSESEVLDFRQTLRACITAMSKPAAD